MLSLTPRPPEDLVEPPGPRPLDRFVDLIAATSPARVLEVGTRQAVPGRSSHLRALFPGVDRADYVMADVAAGADVDVVADIHALPAEWSDRFDAVVANAVFEHLERPWIAAREVARVLAPGGIAWICTHQTFPLHGYPRDFFRFSREALSLLLTDAGLALERVAYEGRSWIVPPPSVLALEQVGGWNDSFPSYVLVSAVARKPA